MAGSMDLSTGISSMISSVFSLLLMHGIKVAV